MSLVASLFIGSEDPSRRGTGAGTSFKPSTSCGETNAFAGNALRRGLSQMPYRPSNVAFPRPAGRRFWHGGDDSVDEICCIPSLCDLVCSLYFEALPDSFPITCRSSVEKVDIVSG